MEILLTFLTQFKYVGQAISALENRNANQRTPKSPAFHAGSRPPS